MSESILNALMQLFALIGDIHDDTVITGREKNIVRIFLIRHLSNEQVEIYMRKFEEYLGMFNAENIEKGSIRDRKRISLNAMRILAICEKINEELEQRQKVYVMVRLIDYISHGAEVSDTELDFLLTVSSAFNIPAAEFESMKSFIMGAEDEISGRARLLVIDNKKYHATGSNHIISEKLKGKILFLNIRSTNTWLMRYRGSEVLYLNGQNIQEGDTYIFDTGSSIRGSGIKAIYFSEVAGHLSTSHVSAAVLEAVDINFRFRRSDNGVHDLNFEGRSGELVGIIGGSGVGKSTTLSILSGTLRPQQGKILINGYDLYNADDREKLRGVIGFVPQDDLLIEELTVYRNLYYNARMCLSNLSPEKLDEAVERILNDLDLSGARDLKVGNPLDKVISGGQRKRINIALELMREPTILFVDEPTSGLSSVDSEMVMSLLKDLTFKGKLVIVNIHQPSSDIYKMFDRIMIIDRGGYQVFCGNPSEAIVYFKVQTNHANPDEDQCTKCGNVDTEQILQIIESKVLDEHGKPTRVRKISAPEWSNRFRTFFPVKKDEGIRVKHTLPGNSYSIPGKFSQTLIFFSRDILSKLANRQYIAISLLGPPLLALLLSFFIKTPAGADYLFSENVNIPSYLFMCVITAMFFGLMGSAEEIVRDRKILRRESFLDLSWFSYLNSKVLIMFILSAIQTLSFVLVGNLILEIRGMTFSYWLVLFTTSCFANLLGLNLSSAFRSVITIYILIPFIIIPQLLFSGVIVKFDKLNAGSPEFVPAIGEAMIIRWAFESIAVEQFRNNAYSRMFFDYNTEISHNERNGLIVDALNVDLSINRKYNDSLEVKEEVLGNYKKLVLYTAQMAADAGVDFPAELRASLDPENFNDAAYKEFFKLLDSLKSVFNKRMTVARERMDSVMQKVEDQMGKEEVVSLMDRYENKELTKLLLNQLEIKRTIETTDRIISRHDPGYMKATSPNGRAHFYAPSKTLFNWEIRTFAFNLMVIWLITLFFYIILNFRVFEKVVKYFGSLRLTGD